MVRNVSSVCFADPLETVPIFTVAWYSLPLTRAPNTPRICFPMITLDPGECIVLWTTSTFIFSRAFIVFIALLFSHCSKSTSSVFSHLTFICSGPCYGALVVTVIHVPFSSVWFHTSKIPIKLKPNIKKTFIFFFNNTDNHVTTFILCTGDESCGEIVFCHNCNISARGHWMTWIPGKVGMFSLW